LSYSARKFVEWYNSHPYSHPIPLKDVESVSVIGNGNVAVDVVRILGSSIERLE